MAKSRITGKTISSFSPGRMGILGCFRRRGWKGFYYYSQNCTLERQIEAEEISKEEWEEKRGELQKQMIPDDEWLPASFFCKRTRRSRIHFQVPSRFFVTEYPGKRVSDAFPRTFAFLSRECILQEFI